MHEQLDALLCTRYPAIFSACEPGNQRLFGFECGDGWFTLIEAACRLIQHHINATGTEQLMASQVKEKFGGLRFYCRHASDYATSVVDLSESLSLHVCEVCGAPGRTVSRSGWMRTRCPEHESTTAYDERIMKASRENILQSPSIADVMEASLAFFALDSQSAARWLTQPAMALGHAVPLHLAVSAEGQRQVLTLIGRLEHGVSS
ncbi:DUF2384 domain-containing protein [Pseudomonas sp. sp1636]|uniref:antitoxin Xre/MbcA/ParS toxin-binding domain-containing protein n=1 Tax=Pseudomonas sp. sp1636 TaxID=3036707 RepID=UPI0025A67A89|nr:antitoxin Xre/MbcA/ParS toxin-binding domain-containing protein [Pseudomonas sp. sp1636]MDM8347678.1 DUF2384 domain-containing protein [Pseudomonas sp. sp1636]